MKPPSNGDKLAKQATADRAAAERAAKRAAADRAAVEKLLDDRRQEEIEAAKRATLGRADAEKMKHEGTVSDAGAAEAQEKPDASTPEQLQLEKLKRTIARLQAGNKLSLHTDYWAQGLKNVQFSLRLQNETLVFSDILFRFDLEHVSQKLKEAISNGSPVTLYFRWYDSSREQFLEAQQICCWIDRDLVGHKKGAYFSGESRTVALKSAKDLSSAEAVLANKLHLLIYFRTNGVSGVGGGGKTMKDVLDMAAEAY